MNPNVLAPRSIKISHLKLEDTKRLLEIHYGANWEEFPQLNFYKNLFFAQKSNTKLQTTAENDLCEITEDENPALMV